MRDPEAAAGLAARAAAVELGTVHPGDPRAVAAVRSYFSELQERFPSGFDPGPAREGESMAPGAGAFVLATSSGEPVACGGVQALSTEVGEIKRMWVHPDWRGAGLGSRLLGHLEDVAAGLGHTVVRLDTNQTLVEAIAMYERAGYRRIDRYNDNPYAQAWFEKSLVTSGRA